ncbi:MAG: methyltransferase domain-containing protein, partial [bacterium]
CWQIAYGIESGSQRILDVKREVRLPRLRETLQMTRAAGIRTKGYVMPGHPTEGLDSVTEGGISSPAQRARPSIRPRSSAAEPPTMTADAPGGDRDEIDWRTIALPDGWPDRLNFASPRDLATFLRRLFGRRRRVEIPSGLPGADRLPDYLQHEFHHLPNGNYSKRIVSGYSRWFDLVMLRRSQRARTTIAHRLARCRATLDVGCGAGELTGLLLAQGVPEVWGLDPSPFLLRVAAHRHPQARLVQAVAEATGFPAGRFDGAGVCFVFHELPTQVGDRALAELHRILTPGAVLVLAEPSPLHFRPNQLRRFLRTHGVLGLYFWLLACVVYEPFAAAWHRRDVRAWLDAHGFDLCEDEVGMPIRLMTAIRRA